MTIAFAYFTKSDVLYSIWFFHCSPFFRLVFSIALVLDFGGSDMWCSMAPAIGWQSFGGFIILVLWGLWMARAHLRDVWRKVWSRNAPIDDEGELLSYRTAFIILILCSIYTVFFLVQSGMNVLTLLTFWGATLILYLGLAHIIAESGLVFLRGPITAQAFTWHVLGIAGMGAPSAVALGLTYTFFCDAKNFCDYNAGACPSSGRGCARRTPPRFCSRDCHRCTDRAQPLLLLLLSIRVITVLAAIILGWLVLMGPLMVPWVRGLIPPTAYTPGR